MKRYYILKKQKDGHYCYLMKGSKHLLVFADTLTEAFTVIYERLGINRTGLFLLYDNDPYIDFDHNTFVNFDKYCVSINFDVNKARNELISQNRIIEYLSDETIYHLAKMDTEEIAGFYEWMRGGL